jgi:phosphohistidine phosphatase
VKRLFLLRHAKSSWDDPALPDVERPLAPRGRKAAKSMADYFKRQRVRPGLVLCSSAKRTRETLERMVPVLGKGATIEVEAGLYAASAEDLLARLRRVPDTVASVMVIGHNPGLQDLALMLAAGGDELPRVREKFPTGALVVLELRRLTWSGLQPGSAEVVGLVLPRELG